MTPSSPVLDRPAPVPDRTRRDPLFDNAKMILIVLVVVGHTWSQLPEDALVVRSYDFLYSWHMPAFVVVTGYLSRTATWQPERLRSLVTSLALPYVVFESALTFVHVRFGGAEVHDFLLVPHSPMWFLLALIGWRLLTPLLLGLPRGPALAGAVALSLLAGLIATEALAFTRILGFLPFFVLGLHLRRGDWDTLRRFLTVPRALAVLAALVVLTGQTGDAIASSWFHYDTAYRLFGVPALEGMATRLLVLGMGLAGTAAFLALVPRTRSWLTVLGAATLVVYLFHDFAVLAMTYSGYPEWAADHLVPAFALGTVASVLVGLTLAAPRVTTVLTPLADPVGALQERRTAAPRSG